MKGIEPDSVYKLLVRLFNPNSEQGKIQNNKAMTEGIPDSLQALMNNISVLSQEISRFTDRKRVPVIDFRIWPYFKFTKKQLKSLLENEDLEFSGHLSEKEKNGGEIYIFAKSIIIDTKDNKDDWLYIEYGYQLSIEKGNKDYKSSLFAQIYGKNIKDTESELYVDKLIGNTILSNKGKCFSYLSQLINTVSKKGINKTEYTIYKKALKTLAESSKKFI